jgi:hypothetical protein
LVPWQPYSQDLRERVFAAADEGELVGWIATMLRVSVSYVSKVLSRRRLTGQTQARPQRCHVVHCGARIRLWCWEPIRHRRGLS